LNCALALHKNGTLAKFNCKVLGTPMDAIWRTEDRDLFRAELEKIGERVAPSKAATTLVEAEQAAEEVI
jgi:carbamoylphosphate synthase large subunit